MAQLSNRRVGGFTLFELMFVIRMILLLVSISMESRRA